MAIEKQTLEQIRELIENRDFASLRKLAEDFAPADIAEIFSESDEEDLLILFRLLPKDTAAECFVEMDTDVQQSLIEALSDKELTEIVDDLFLDDAVDIIEEMPANMVKRILENTSPETRARINQLLKYPKDSAGSIMTVEFVELRAKMTVSEAFERIRATGLDKETVYTCYVTDDRRTLIGIVTVKDMLLAKSDAVVGDIMTTTIISVTTTTDKEETAKTLAKYDFMALPVVDNENRLVGIVTVDDAIDVIKEEDTEDIELMAAILPSDKPYLKTSVFEIWRKRIPWLLLLMVSATFTGAILRNFETALSAVPVLIAFIPMIMDTGGNAGGQASATVIRGLSLGDIEMRDILRVMFKEVRVAAMCGVTLAVINFGKIMLFHEAQSWTQAVVVCATLALAVVIAKIVGCSLPILAKRIGFDPAVMASPFITTIVDALALLVYFGIAKSVLAISRRRRMYIGIDLGTTACKTTAYDASGSVLAEYESEYELITRDGGVYQDASEWWDQVSLGIRSVVAECGDNIVDGISASTQGISFVPTNERGTPLFLSVNWLDTRAKEECADLVAHFGADHIHRVTGKLAQPSYSLPMIMRFAKEYPEVFSHAAHICLPLDFINLRLTGRHVADYTVAGGTMAFDLAKGEYDRKMLDFAGVPASKLPEIGCMGDLVGTVTPDVAAELGIAGDMKVFLGGQDQKLAALGAGIEDGVMTVSIGTATAVTRLLDSLPDDASLSLFRFDRERFSAEGVVATSGSALKWFKSSFFGGARYRDLDVLAEQAGTSGGVRIDPDFTTGASITGVTLGTTSGNVLFALYEGVCRQIAEKVGEMGGAKLLKVFGGGSRSDIWCQILADTAHIPVAVCETPQTACLGAAILASEGKIAPCGVKKTFAPR